MSTVMADVSALLETALNNLNLGYSISWDNVDFTPTQGQPFLVPKLLPSIGTAAGLGYNAQNRHDGTFQVNVYTPTRQGHGQALTIADQIAGGLKRGTALSQNNTNVRITAVYRGPAVSQDQWFAIPVSFTYYAYADN